VPPITKAIRKRRSKSPARAGKRASLDASPDGNPHGKQDGCHNEWKIRRAGAVKILTADALSRIPWLVHGFSTRAGGQSRLHKGRALNLGFTDWDRPEAVAQNRRKLQQALGARTMPLVALAQIHSDVAHVIAAPPTIPLQGDAILTRRPGLLLAVQTADCVPILLVDTEQHAVAAIHAGWRGTLARIAAKTLGRMRLEWSTEARHVVAALGPAIGRCCYEVGPEVAQAFAAQFAPAAEWFDGPFARLALGEEPNPLPWLTMMPPGHEPPPERVQLDLRAANRWQLVDAGVEPGNISVSTLCTACRTDLFFSYRREASPAGSPRIGSPRVGSPQVGRMMAAIGIRAKSR
jgi:polyphenol oxidase